ncbi:unnamed protein product [Discosporangium mesarthrocarpum]
MECCRIFCSDMYRPVAGSHHDAYMRGRSNLVPKVENMQECAPVQHVVYGDTAYLTLFHVKRGCRRTTNIQQGQGASKMAMSVAGISIEWSFEQQFPFLDYKKNLNLHLSSLLQSCILRQLSLSTCTPASMAV